MHASVPRARNDVGSGWWCAALLSQAVFLKTYTQYVNEYRSALALLKKLGEEKPAFAEYIAKLNAHPDVGKQTIKDFLIMPVQRIPRYTMLLQVRTFLFCATLPPISGGGGGGGDGGGGTKQQSS